MDLSRFEPIVETTRDDAKAAGIEPNAHSFIVKIWIEEPAEKTGLGRWRGHITHVLTGNRRYFEDLGEVVRFITLYLEQMNVRFGKLWKIRHWLHRL